jgi:hypothetical protein
MKLIIFCFLKENISENKYLPFSKTFEVKRTQTQNRTESIKNYLNSAYLYF